jgi:hypothetical protein
MFRPFYELFPEVAERESRSLKVQWEHPKEGSLPVGSYLFLEVYCVDPECDCERVLLSVVEKKLGIVATISYGFESVDSPKEDEPSDLFLDPSNKQSVFAADMLSLFKEVALDAEYDQRLKRHYRMVKARTPDENHVVGTLPCENGKRDMDPRESLAKERREQQQRAARRTDRR